MEIILLEDSRHLGRRGDVIDVRPGYARNFLLPKGIALEATAGNIAYFEQQRKKIDAVHSKKLEEAQQAAAELGAIRIEIKKRVGERETLYGSVTAADLVEELAAKGVTVEKRQLDLGSPTLKTLGEHPVKVDLHADVEASFTVAIVSAE
ncbi:MAG: 50S ribosomal protein L9 [Acidobacteriota bacterium]